MCPLRRLAFQSARSIVNGTALLPVVATLEALKAKHGIRGRIEIRTGGAAGTINALAKEENADLVIIASHRPGLIDYFIGSTASRVVSHCPCAVLVDR